MVKFRMGLDAIELKRVAGVPSKSSSPPKEGSNSNITDGASQSLIPTPPPPTSSMHIEVARQPFNARFEISRRRFSIDKSKQLGAGEFGQVYLGKVRTLNDGENLLPVAIKVPQKNCPETVLSAMLKELKIMTELSHENLVSLIGACTLNAAFSKLYILMEYCEEGSVEQYLEKNKCNYVPVDIVTSPCSNYKTLKFSFRCLVRWSAEVAAGMEFLSERAVVHRDLAARNVLLTSAMAIHPRKPLQAKVSDFGLSRHLYGNPEYKQKSKHAALPWRLMAPECFDGIFSTGSDVWAYGILLWELFSLGELPYANLSTAEQLNEILQRGNRITARPDKATDQILRKMHECWHQQPSERPDFKNLKDFFTIKLVN